ncbi:carboxypeptidase regulatory-like domain-containing protein [Nocardioides campestrisoli]|uniref:carboxypeptidase regulatory-like domain-containing protein n=1 Tax=Nocardioides campestrisoli TaxID=2736757 RepID=UPI0015E6D909|nr:carboxypeptidase regulatory-like domain-containing protein [Nocardioides campestrisoli]
MFAGLLTVLATAGALFLTVPAAQAGPGASPGGQPAPEIGDKIRPKLAQQLEAKGEATFWIRFEQADLSAASQVRGWAARGEAVRKALTSAADQQQKEVRELLDDEGVAHRSFWATNAIRVEAGDTALVSSIARAPEVLGLYPTVEYALEKPTKGREVREVDAVEWGLANINADDVWSQRGVTGEGLVIANIDTGVQFDHPALVRQYRGNNGDGTFTHDYSWFDASGGCATAPCDTNGHGTHTMGTMLGDDGNANQIGVAPGATWIAANGCCPSDAALIESGEWMLAPTDLAGANPDAGKRPHIINNSWGTTQPSNDPFMEDVTQAWAASGIWGQWSNGNSGPSCSTSGSPGSRTLNYSSGAHDVNNAIAGFSARGAGQDGEIKPNISAPGVNVRSALPNSTYGSYNGTSMASPHVAGTVALLWSAAPSLVGDIDATWALLDGSAQDSAATQCGGTADDNNVFGEGRLDALALVDAAPVGETGTVTGTVTDAATGQPIEGATVALDGEFDRTVTTAADGTYDARLSVGTYTVTATKYGYQSKSSQITVEAGTPVTADFALQAAPSVTVTGTVTDGSGHDWPLYAQVQVEGPGEDVWTDPETGEYTLTVPSNASYTVTVDAHYPGYTSATEEITVGNGATTHDVALEVDASTCTAPGYRFNTTGITEDFDGGGLPAGWTIQDEAGNGQVWRFDDPKPRGNLTGGDGAFAIADSDFFGSGQSQDTSLVTPSIDMSSVTSPVVGFRQDYNNLGDVADVDLSIDGGATWETVLHQVTDVRGPREDVVQLPAAAGESDVKIRFHYYEASYDWWWQVDDVFVGNRTCDPIRGGLVVGTVTSARNDEGINGAVVTSLDKPDEKATTQPTPEDENLSDGFYWMFSTLRGKHPFEARAAQYQSVTEVVAVDLDDATRADFELGSGNLVVTPDEITATKRLGTGTVTKTFTVTNDGSAPVELEFEERPGGFDMLTADGGRTNLRSITKQAGAPLMEVKAPVSVAARSRGMSTHGAQPANGPHEAPWTDIADHPSTVMDNRVVHVDGTAYSIAGGDGSASTAKVRAYDPATLAWTEKASLPEARNAVAAGLVDGQIVVTGGWAAAGPSTATWTYDPAADSWAAGAAAPVALAASGQAVADGKLFVVGGCTTASCTPMSNATAAYDLATDSWETLAPYPAAVAFASCGAVDGTIYCTGGNGGANGTADSYAYDIGADAWTPIADAPVDTWASAHTVANGMLVVNGGVQGTVITNRTFAFDPEADAWIDLPNSNTARYRGGMACGLYKVGGSSGGFTATADSETLPGFENCGTSGTDVEWLSLDTTSATLAPGKQLRVRVFLDSEVAQPGTYTAAIAIKEDTPGSVAPIPVTFEVTPPVQWGKLVGTVSGRACTGTVAALPGATVQVDSWAGSWTLETGSDGSYAQWFNAGANPLSLIAAKDGYAPQSRTVRLAKGTSTTASFTLKKARC